MHPFLTIAVRAARRAGTIMVRHLDRVQDLKVDLKGRNDFVTQVDRMAEAAIVDVVQRAYPDHAILGEEGGARAGDGQDAYEWVIDPLDGTTNYVHGFPQFGVSIAVRRRGRVEQACIFDPLRQELFLASRGGGALLNDRRIRVSRRQGLEGALLGTGFPVRDKGDFDLYLETFRALSQDTAGIRRAGSAALDLAYVACGRLDGFWEMALSPWDMAAGALLVEEAGGLVGDFVGGADYMRSGNISAGNPRVFKELVQRLRPLTGAPPTKVSRRAEAEAEETPVEAPRASGRATLRRRPAPTPDATEATGADVPGAAPPDGADAAGE